jgi:rSAM/selenodomain-associated transferase 2
MKVMLSIIIPVHQEAEIINQTLMCLQPAASSEDFEVIVVDGHPEGDTIKAIDGFDVKKAFAEKGRALQMNKGAALAAGDILIFLHADTYLKPGILDNIRPSLAAEDAVAGAFKLGIHSPGKGYRIIETVAFWRTRITRIPYGDQVFFFKSHFFRRLGGYAEIPIMEDVELMRRVKKSGEKTILLPTEVQTSNRRWEREGIVCCTLRNWAIMTLYMLGVSPRKLAKFYR